MFSFIPAEKFRYERKFFISEMDKHAVERVLRFHPALFSEIYYERCVNNIYFDSMNMRSYHENEAGARERFKARIRWYGDLRGRVEKPKLEFKIKTNMLGTKLSYKLKPFSIDETLSLKNLKEDIFPESDLPGWAEEGLKSLKPVLVNRYKRKYFLSADKMFRVTLDTEMDFYRIMQWKNSFREKYGIGNGVVLELKYSGEDDNAAERITNDFPFRLTKNSKYVTGIDFLSW